MAKKKDKPSLYLGWLAMASNLRKIANGTTDHEALERACDKLTDELGVDPKLLARAVGSAGEHAALKSVACADCAGNAKMVAKTLDNYTN